MARTRVIGYCRVSTTDQKDNGSSLAAQESKLRSYCAALDLDLVTVEVDAGFSAATLKRPALTRALAALKARQADALLICKLDRLTRNLTDLGTLVDRYFKRRASLISVEESINTTTAAGMLVLNLLTSCAAWERQSCGERVHAVKQHQKAQGRFLGGGVSFGYRLTEDGTLVPHDGEQLVIEAARALKAQGLSYRAIAATLDERGLRARSGAIGVGHVQRMLSA